MKKIIGLLISVLFFANLQVEAQIEVQPTFFSKSNEQDRVWVGSFQLAWNDFINKIVYNPVRFREGTPIFVGELNKKSFSVNDISEKSYYKYVGKVRKNTKKQITKAIRKKFKESSDILDKLDLTPRSDMFIIYAMLKKDFDFENAFDKLGHSTFNGTDVAEFFGIGENSDELLGQGVAVLFYNNPDDYAVKLATKGDDEIYLYKNLTNKPFNLLYADMRKKQKTFEGETEFKKIDELKIPNLEFFQEKSYSELVNRRIMGTNIVINQALQTVSFNLDNKGGKVKSEAGLTAEVTSLLPPEELIPRHFYFDGTFVIFLKESGKRSPYCALRVNDIKKFQKKN